MLARRRPFTGDSTAGTLAAILRDAPAPMVGLAPDVTRLLGRCLRKDEASDSSRPRICRARFSAVRLQADPLSIFAMWWVAVLALRRANELSGGISFTLGFLAMVSGGAGLLADVRRLSGQASQMAGATYAPPPTFMCCAAGLGDWDAALKWMDRVRGDAGCGALLRKMHLE